MNKLVDFHISCIIDPAEDAELELSKKSTEMQNVDRPSVIPDISMQYASLLDSFGSVKTQLTVLKSQSHEQLVKYEKQMLKIAKETREKNQEIKSLKAEYGHYRGG